MNDDAQEPEVIKVPKPDPVKYFAIKMRERCRAQAALWLPSCQTVRETELVNGICGDIDVISFESLEDK